MSSLTVNRLLAFPVERVLSYYGYRAQRFGSRSKMRCPFHQETQASFVVYHDDNKCHCFGCGKTWDGVGLVKEFDKIRFTPAIRKLAKIAGVNLSEQDVLNVRKQFQRGSCLIRDGRGDKYWKEAESKVLEGFTNWYQKLPHVKHLYHYIDYIFEQIEEIESVENFGVKQLDAVKDLIIKAKKFLEKRNLEWVEFKKDWKIPRDYWAERVDEDFNSPFVGNW